MKLILLFPGQGAQYVGMGADLHARYAGARRVFDAASEALGEDLAALCAAGPAETLTRTLYAQPAVVATSLAALAALREAAAERDLDLRPVAVAGHSVGELAAMAAADAFDTDTVLRLVVARARAMEESCVQVDGGMTAILGLDAAAAEAACAAGRAESGEHVAVANYNAPDQLVIAGTRRALAAAGAQAERLGAKRVIPLKVAGPFHTALMAGASAAFHAALRRAPIRPASAPVILNASADAATDTDALCAELERQIASPVCWSQSMARCAELGADACLELGPGQVLSGLVKRQLKSVPALNVQDTSGLAPALDALAALAAH